jgi:hypothetical protein
VRFLVLALLAAGCTPEHGHFPGGNGGVPMPGGSGSGTGKDAGIDGEIGRIRGRICRVVDLRAGAACTPITGVALRVTVRETNATDVTDDEGRFDLPGSATPNPVTLVTAGSDAVYQGTAFPLYTDNGTAVVELPIVRRADLIDLAATNLIGLDEERGVVAVHLRRNGGASVGSTVGELGGSAPLYATADPLVYALDPPTGSTGSVLWLNVSPGTRAFTVTGAGIADGGVPPSFSVPVLAGYVTFTPISL